MIDWSNWGMGNVKVTLTRVRDPYFMKKIILISLLLSAIHPVLINNVESQEQKIVWQKNIVSSYTSTKTGLIQISNNNYLYCGTLRNNSSDLISISIYNINGDGDIIWHKTYNQENANTRYSKIIKTNDNNYLILGDIDKGEPNVNDFYIIKINSSGNIIFERTYGNIDQQSSYSVIETKDGDFIILGSTNTRTSPDPFPWPINIIKINKNGDLIWQKEYGNIALINVGVDLIEITGGKYIIIGSQSDRSLPPIFKTYLFCIDSTGAILFDKSFADSSNEVLTKIVNVDDGILLLGIDISATTGKSYIKKADFNLNIQWTKYIDLVNVFSMEQTDSYYIFDGFDIKLNPTVYEGAILLTDQNINTVSKIYLSEGYNNMVQTIVKGGDAYYITGIKYNVASNGIYYSDTTLYTQYLVKVKVITPLGDGETSNQISGYPEISILIGLFVSLTILLISRKYYMSRYEGRRGSVARISVH